MNEDANHGVSLLTTSTPQENITEPHYILHPTNHIQNLNEEQTKKRLHNVRCGDQLMALAWSRGRNSLSSQLPAFLPNHRSSSPAAQQNGRQGRKKRETRLPSSHCCLCWKIGLYLGEEKNLDKKSHPWELWDPFLGELPGKRRWCFALGPTCVPFGQ